MMMLVRACTVLRRKRPRAWAPLLLRFTGGRLRRGSVVLVGAGTVPRMPVLALVSLVPLVPARLRPLRRRPVAFVPMRIVLLRSLLLRRILLCPVSVMVVSIASVVVHGNWGWRLYRSRRFGVMMRVTRRRGGRDRGIAVSPARDGRLGEWLVARERGRNRGGRNAGVGVEWIGRLPACGRRERKRHQDDGGKTRARRHWPARGRGLAWHGELVKAGRAHGCAPARGNCGQAAGVRESSRHGWRRHGPVVAGEIDAHWAHVGCQQRAEGGRSSESGMVSARVPSGVCGSMCRNWDSGSGVAGDRAALTAHVSHAAQPEPAAW